MATDAGVAKKLNLKPGMKLRIVGKATEVRLPGVTGAGSAKAEAVTVFAKTLAEVDSRAGPAIDAAREDRVRQVALDEVWSAMRFRPKK